MTTIGINQDYRLNLRVLTPLHVGGTQEKHLEKGLDFVQDGSKIHLIDHEKLFKKIDIYELAKIFVTGDKDLLKQTLQREKVKLNDITHGNTLQLAGIEFSEIKAFIKEGLNGKPFVPGSSLKGAIRSIVFAHLKTLNDGDERSILGNFETSIFRHIKIGDAFFDQIELYPCKTFNLRGFSGKLSGGWRDGNNNTNEKFNDTRSIFVYECLPPGVTGELSIRILDHDGPLFKTLIRGVNSLPSGFSSIIKSKPLINLFQIINQHTLKHLEKEIKFFSTYKVAETPEIVASLERIKEIILLNQDNQWCVLKMAHGSGFHSITGDWQYPKDYTDPNDIHKSGYNQGKKKYKSRKLLFKGGKFFPMGYVLIGNNLPENNLNKIENIRTTSDEILKKEILPIFQKGKIRVNSTLDGIVVKSGNPNMVKVYLNEPSIIELPMIGYRGPLDTGRIVEVLVKELNKNGEVKSVGFKKIKFN
jgi:hypothetical protein